MDQLPKRVRALQFGTRPIPEQDTSVIRLDNSAPFATRAPPMPWTQALDIIELRLPIGIEDIKPEQARKVLEYLWSMPLLDTEKYTTLDTERDLQYAATRLTCRIRVPLFADVLGTRLVDENMGIFKEEATRSLYHETHNRYEGLVAKLLGALEGMANSYEESR